MDNKLQLSILIKPKIHSDQICLDKERPEAVEKVDGKFLARSPDVSPVSKDPFDQVTLDCRGFVRMQ